MNALFVGLDVADLAAVGTLALCTGSSAAADAAFGWGVACRGPGGALLFLARETALLVAVQTAEFCFDAGRRLGEERRKIRS